MAWAEEDADVVGLVRLFGQKMWTAWLDAMTIDVEGLVADDMMRVRLQDARDEAPSRRENPERKRLGDFSALFSPSPSLFFSFHHLAATAHPPTHPKPTEVQASGAGSLTFSLTYTYTNHVALCGAVTCGVGS
ncbi:hypothetical protein THAOC_36194 [Thalassiosira oceanica]|uniref:Uncharacterized protein n=1 Tax=Thalassiosira oceanica TaxID=159749 RepID=K0RFB5_THAOC|nr:hypothetical protein THAOC_36194 [Thalassiosira oceanica]|eukprot:EJK45202.1 hypothetical protein THAOC_36194 [Thalassiosira oceanica]